MKVVSFFYGVPPTAPTVCSFRPSGAGIIVL